MNRKFIPAFIVFAALLGFGSATSADTDRQKSWQLSLLFTPGDHQQKMEKRGRVFIYDGMQAADNEKAFDEQYARIESMMFVNTVVTDPETGEQLVEDDGCD